MTVSPQSLGPPLTHPCFGWNDETVRFRRRKGFPWWWVALGAGVLLLAGNRKEKKS